MSKAQWIFIGLVLAAVFIVFNCTCSPEPATVETLESTPMAQSTPVVPVNVPMPKVDVSVSPTRQAAECVIHWEQVEGATSYTVDFIKDDESQYPSKTFRWYKNENGKCVVDATIPEDAVGYYVYGRASNDKVLRESVQYRSLT